MSIAVSTVVRPSRLLLLLSGGMSLLVFSIGALIAANLLGELDLLMRISLGVVCMMLASWAGMSSIQSRKTHHVDISGHGQIRLTEYVGSAAQSLPAILGDGGMVSVVRLAADSTLWPGLMVLRLQTDDQRIIVLPVLPDSVEAGGFRPLALACRWIAAHNHPTTQTHDAEKSPDD